VARLTLSSLVVFLLCLDGMAARMLGQDALPPRRSVEERIADLERRVDVFQHQLRELQDRLRSARVSWICPLKHAAALEVATLLAGVTGGPERGIIVVPEPITNKLLVSAPADKIEPIRKLLAALDELGK
jgi:type II secretory pathway component GspD/PulD (secretin)